MKIQSQRPFSSPTRRPSLPTSPPQPADLAPEVYIPRSRDIASDRHPGQAIRPLEQQRLAGQLARQSSPLFGIGGLIFPDSGGKIKHMALQLGNVEFDKPLPGETREALLDVWQQLMQKMSPDTRFTIVCADSSGQASVEKLVEQSGIESERLQVVNAHSERGMSIWIRDSMLPVLGPAGETRLLVQDRTYWPGPEDGQIAPLLQQANPEMEHQPHPALRIDGGNVLSNHKQTIVGSDSIRHTRARLQELAQDPEKKKSIEEFYQKASGKTPDDSMWEELPRLVFENEFKKPVLVVARDREQPAFHIDMTMTPLADDRFLVGDPSMAIAALRSLSPEEKAATNRAMALQAGITSGEDLVEKLIQANSSPEKQADYDATARELADAGYEIQRIPALMGLRTTWSVPYLTYNNCMLEDYVDASGQTVKKVYLPQYGCGVLDQMAQAIYRSHGYEVVPLEMGAISKLEGAIRCSSYAIERDF